jgi:uncharacterized phiE125 gp8 family phage protein
MSLKLKTAPLIEPVSLDEAKLHLRIDTDDEDTLIASYITAAREYCEGFQNRTYINTVYELWLDEFPSDDEIELPNPPLVSVTSVDVYDTSNTKTADTTLTNYYVDSYSNPGRLCLAYNCSWPSTTLREHNGICITFTAGFGTAASSTPQVVKQSILLLIGDYYAFREAGKASEQTLEAVYRLLWLNRSF